MIADSGERKTFGNGFNRDITEGKGRMDLLPWLAIREVSIHCEEGAKKYGERNIDKGAPQWSLYSSAMRHLSKAIEPMSGDSEDTRTHLRAAAWNILWALQQYCKEDDLNNDIAEKIASKPLAPTIEKKEAKPKKEKAGAPEAPKDKPKKRRSKSLAKPKDVPKVKALKAAGWSIAKIADEFNVAPGTIYNWLKEEA